MRAFCASRGLDHPDHRRTLAEGSRAWRFRSNLETYERRRTAMLALLKVASGLEPFGSWLKHSDSIAARRNEKLDTYLDALYMLLDDVLRLTHGVTAIRNAEIRAELDMLARKVSFDWLRAAVTKVDALMELVGGIFKNRLRWMRWPSICARNEIVRAKYQFCPSAIALPWGLCYQGR